MAKNLTMAQCEFIVRKLAAFEPPRSIVIDFWAVFPALRIDVNDVLRLDPGVTLVTPELHALFLAERERVMLDPSSALFADQKARLILLSKHVTFHNSNNELAEARSVVRQIAEETGAIGGPKGTKAPSAPGGDKLPDSTITWKIVDSVSDA